MREKEWQRGMNWVERDELGREKEWQRGTREKEWQRGANWAERDELNWAERKSGREGTNWACGRK